ncbi:MAG: hypothetical protein R3B69_02775 [Candidatus Paceibacterota bacterium]
MQITGKTLANNTTTPSCRSHPCLRTLLSGGNPLKRHKKLFSVRTPMLMCRLRRQHRQETCLRENSKGEINVSTNCDNNNRGGGRSLVISAGSMTAQTYLQTLFPRYVQTAQEVVRIPRALIQSLGDTDLVVRIKATKKTQRCGATLSSLVKVKTPELVPLKITKATHERTGTDHSTNLTKKNEQFLHTIPEVMWLMYQFKDAPRSADTRRHYVLTTNGFYTKLSQPAAYQIGPRWLSRLHKKIGNCLRRCG